jgi:putative NADH-flavin reductase
MQNTTKIALIGGTGKAGKFLLTELLKHSFTLNLLLRNPDKLDIQDPLIEIVQGDARDPASIRLLLQDCDVVLSTIGWCEGDTAIFSQTTRNVIGAMKECHVRRYISVTGLNVDTPFDKKSVATKAATDWMRTNYPETTADKQAEYNMLCDSDCEWILIRLPLIELTDNTGRVMISLDDCPGPKISATDLACFVIGQLYDNRYIRTAPFIASV